MAKNYYVELTEEKARLKKRLNEIEMEFEKLNAKIVEGKITKVCSLLKDLWKNYDVCEQVTISNYDGDEIQIDFEDLVMSIERHFDI